MYWSVRDLPAMQRLTHPERRALCRTYAWRSFRRPQTWLGVVAVVMAAAAGETLAFRLLPQLAYPHALLHGVLPVLVCEIFGFACWLQWQFVWMNDAILNDHPELCRMCGYDMHVTPGRCPECGQEPKSRHLHIEELPWPPGRG